jgi:hypothetical protein
VRLIASYISICLAAAAVLFALTTLAIIPPEYCGADLGQPRTAMTVMTDGPTPTLAPPRNTVVVRVEVDKPGLEVGWADGP